jgi:hypothetical protein
MSDEEQRVQLATILLFAAFTGSRPAELVDAQLSAKDKKKIKDAFWRQTTPWDDPNDSDYDGTEVNVLDRVKSLCWEDVELRIVALDATCSRCGLHLLITRVLTESHCRMSLIFILLRYLITDQSV